MSTTYTLCKSLIDLGLTNGLQNKLDTLKAIQTTVPVVALRWTDFRRMNMSIIWAEKSSKSRMMGLKYLIHAILGCLIARSSITTATSPSAEHERVAV